MNDELQLWEVGISPNNQPTIWLGEYYANSAKVAMELAAVDLQMKVDECFFAQPIKNKDAKHS